MKKIYSIILTVAALLSFATAVNAQGDYSIAKQITDPKNNNASVEYPPETTNPVHFDDVNKVAYAKNVSKPFKDGTYWIKLETFATGTASYTMSSEPADIVLVLDVSQSMIAEYGDYVAIPSCTYSYQNYNYQTSTANQNVTYYYKYTDGNYYEVSRGGNSRNTARYLSFRVGSTTYYLNDNVNGGQPSTTAPGRNDGPTNNNNTIWTGVLYEKTRLGALRNAVSTFLEEIYHNDNYEDETNDHERSNPLGNRVSVVTFAPDAASNTVTRICKGLTPVTNADGSKNEDIISDIMSLTTRANVDASVGINMNSHYGTYSNRGMALANNVLAGIDDDRKEGSSRTVVLFTDGYPGSGPGWENNALSTADACITQASIAKTTHDATVFTVVLFDGTMNQQMRNYLQYTSSNYPDASNYDNPGSKGEGDYALEAGDDLEGVFQEIARQSGGDTNTSLSAATSTVDIVSNSFILPDGVFETDADINDYVKVFTAKLNTITSAGEYVFDEEVLAPHSTDTYDVYVNGVKTQEGVDVDGTEANPTISVTLEGTNNIKVNGFDYANNWCGPIENESHQIIGHQGHKIIIMIPIKMNPEAVGGPNVATNDPGSGIIIPGQTDPIITFESPTVSLPVNIHIEKTGLNPGESAKFKIERAEIPLNGSYNIDNLTWKYVSSVFVTQPQGAAAGNKPVVKVKGLPSVDVVNNVQVGYLYKITEEDWSWSYERDTDPQYTVTSKVDNPFTFDNEKIEDIDIKIRHAESKVTNIFKKTGGTVKTDDSKPRQTK